MMESRLIAWLTCVVLCGMAVSCGPDEGPAGEGRRLVVLCGAGIQPAMDEVIAAFEKETGAVVTVNYGGSGTLLGQLQTGAAADAYVPGDVAWVKRAQEKDLVGSYRVAAWFVPVLIVADGNPKEVRGLEDLAREKLVVGLGKPDACAVGVVARDVLKAQGLWGRVKPDYESMTVNELCDKVKIGTLDVALVWDAVAKQFGQEIVSIKDAEFHAVPFAVSVCDKASSPELATRFAEFAAGETGAKIFRRHQYTVPGRSIRVGCGASMRPPVDELAAAFQREYGVEVNANYGGSGTVLLQIQESKEADVYVCHDPYAQTCEERGLSESWHTMAFLEPVIAVRKGSEKVKGLMDLFDEDVMVGLPDRKKSTRGKILWTMFETHKLADRMSKKIDARTAIEERTHGLVNKLKLGTVDAAVLWDAPTKADPEIRAIPIDPEYRVDTVTSATSGETYSVDKIKVTVVRLTLSKEPLLTAQFARMCLGDLGRRILQEHKFTLPPKPDSLP
jgi:molybdate transport system substrate-binding protein